MVWFGIGAAIGVLSLLQSVIKRPVYRSAIDVVGGFALSAGAGAIVIGTPLWLIFG